MKLMNHRQIMAWGAANHYPSWWIGGEAEPVQRDEVLRHGSEHYEALRDAPYRLALASKRIARWEAMLAEERAVRLLAEVLSVPANETVVHVDEEREVVG